MSEILFPIIGGSVFVLLGRWMYKNPKKVYPNWAYANPDHPLLIRGVRVFATMMMFVGSYAFIAELTAHVLPAFLPVVVSLVGAILIVRFLRPEVPQAVNAVESDSAHVPRRKQFLSRKGWYVIGASVVLAIVFFVGVFAVIGNSEVCQLAIQQAQSNSTVAARLGTPITKGLLVSGSIETTGPSGHADVSIPVSGPKAKGTLYVVATKSAGEWKFERLRLDQNGSGSIELFDNSKAKPIPQ